MTSSSSGWLSGTSDGLEHFSPLLKRIMIPERPPEFIASDVPENVRRAVVVVAVFRIDEPKHLSDVKVATGAIPTPSLAGRNDPVFDSGREWRTAPGAHLPDNLSIMRALC
jgi:hypothetical protein